MTDPIMHMPFDVVLAATWTLTGGGRLSQRDRTSLGVNAIMMFPDNSIVAMSDLVLTIEDLVAGPDSKNVVDAFLVSGRSVGKRIPWMMLTSFIRLAAQVRDLSPAERARAAVIVRAWGCTPAAFGLGDI